MGLNSICKLEDIFVYNQEVLPTSQTSKTGVSPSDIVYNHTQDTLFECVYVEVLLLCSGYIRWILVEIIKNKDQKIKK